jgi:ABC-type phosphate/phosphonate transport system permease subunit
MLNQNKAAAAVICILMIVALLLISTAINAKLQTPQYIDSYKITDSIGNASREQIMNPQYLTGTMREVYQFFLDFLPTGQAVEISSQSTPHLWQMSLYSILISFVSTVCGIICFRKKDIK